MNHIKSIPVKNLKKISLSETGRKCAKSAVLTKKLLRLYEKNGINWTPLLLEKGEKQ